MITNIILYPIYNKLQRREKYSTLKLPKRKSKTISSTYLHCKINCIIYVHFTQSCGLMIESHLNFKNSKTDPNGTSLLNFRESEENMSMTSFPFPLVFFIEIFLSKEYMKNKNMI